MTVSRNQPYVPPASFGKQAVRLAQSIGKTRDDLIYATGKSERTLYRLEAGDGSLGFAISVRETLRQWGADVSTLPPLVPDDVELSEEWLALWTDLIKRLHALAADDKFDYETKRMIDLVEAHEKVAEGTGRFPRKR